MTFRYTDSATQEKKTGTLAAAEFLRRYLQHVLPPGQHRIRYFGWMHPAAQRRRLRVETLLAKVIVVRPPLPPPPKWHLQCRKCGAFALVEIATIKPGGAVRCCHRATGPPVTAAA